MYYLSFILLVNILESIHTLLNTINMFCLELQNQFGNRKIYYRVREFKDSDKSPTDVLNLTW